MKQTIIDQVIAREGGYSDNPDDSGGKTRYGITEALARRHGFKGAMHELPRAKAVEILAAEFWPASFDDLLALSAPLTAELFDTAVNLGPAHAGKFLQRALNVLNRSETDYPDLKVDGVIGTGTVSAVKTYLKVRRGRGQTALLTAVNSLQGAYYIQLCERRKKDETHLFGWLCHRIML